MSQIKSIIQKQMDNTDDVYENYRRQKKEIIDNLNGGKPEIAIDVSNLEDLKKLVETLGELGGTK